MQMYKTSAIGKPTASRNVSIDIARDEAQQVNNGKDSWADDILFREGSYLSSNMLLFRAYLSISHSQLVFTRGQASRTQRAACCGLSP